MFLIDWYRDWLEIRDNRTCHSCNNLKLQIAHLQQENRLLLEMTLNPPKKEEEKPIDTSDFKPVNPGRFNSFNARRQMLEREDRAKAKSLRDGQERNQTGASDKIADLEEKLGVK